MHYISYKTLSLVITIVLSESQVAYHRPGKPVGWLAETGNSDYYSEFFAPAT